VFKVGDRVITRTGTGTHYDNQSGVIVKHSEGGWVHEYRVELDNNESLYWYKQGELELENPPAPVESEEIAVTLTRKEWAAVVKGDATKLVVQLIEKMA
jgi:hypothetical protein